MRTLMLVAVVAILAGCASPRPEGHPRPFDGYLPPLADGVTAPLTRLAWRPKYPSVAETRGIQGCAWVKFDISTTGKPIHLEVIASLPVADFARPAKAALQHWRFVPAEKNGQPQVVKGAVQQFVFTLDSVKVHAMPNGCSSLLPPH